MRSLVPIVVWSGGCLAHPPERAPFAACFVPVGDLEDPGPGGEANLSGPVLDAGTGEPPDGCFDQVRVASSWEVVDTGTADAWWLQAADDGGAVWTVGVWLPGGPPGPAAGDVVTAALSYLPGGFAPTLGRVEVRDAAGGLAAWVGMGGDLPDLELPAEVALARGDVVGGERGSCGSYASYELQATAGGVSAPVPYGGTVVVGGFELRHGGYDQQRKAKSCPDWYVAHVAVGVAPAP